MLFDEFNPPQRKCFLVACASFAISFPSWTIAPDGWGSIVAIAGAATNLTSAAIATGLVAALIAMRQKRNRMQPDATPRYIAPTMEHSMKPKQPSMKTVQPKAPGYVAPQRRAVAPGDPITVLVKREYAAINATLAAHQIRAKVARVQNVRCSFIRYRLDLIPGERISKIVTINRELANALTAQRQRSGINTPVAVRLSEAPLAIEVPHPDPAILEWSMRHIEQTPAHTMLLGQSCIDAPRFERVSFDEAPHILIVGITKAGKSVLEKMMLLSLCYNTSPDDLKIVLVDLKNEDMLPFANLPHVITFAGRHDYAIEAIRMVRDEKNKRIDNPGYKPYRLVLWIDELAQLAQDKEAKEILGDLASIGRSKDINLVAATQHPTQDGGMGALMKANFPLRLAGMVAPGQSHIATGRPQAGADMLPGRGSFLYCHGPDVYRLQSFHIDSDDAETMARRVIQRWGNRRSTGPTLMHETGAQRDHIDELADEIEDLWINDASKSAMAKYALNKPYAGSYAARIDRAIQRLVNRHSTTTNGDHGSTRVSTQ